MTAEQALIELSRAHAQVAVLTKAIGEALSASIEAQEKAGVEQPVQWLEHAYKMEYGPADHGHGEVAYYVNHDNDLVGYLAEHCQHALRAHHLIQERKAAKRRRATARRRITQLANRLAAAEEGTT